MAKRPSYVSIRARQRNIIEGLGAPNKQNYAKAAKRFGVTPRELKKFTETKPKKLRKNFNRSPTYNELYTKGSRPEVRQALGVKRIQRYRYREQEIKDLKVMQLSPEEVRKRTLVGEAIQNLYTSREHPRYEWARYASENDIPTSIDAIRLLHRNNKINDDEYADAITTWRDIYKIGATRYAMYSDDLSMEYDQEVA